MDALRRVRRRYAVAASALLVAVANAAAPVGAQDGVVLSGGGSRGLAHVGALIGIERRGYQPDLVVGTSMGAIVGALYAAGFTPDSIVRIVRSEKWPALFLAPAFPLGPERAAPQLLLEIGVRLAPSAAAGLASDWRLNQRLVRLLFDPGARARGDFDRMPRRYRAIAADLGNGDAVVLGAGDLARAVRASMSVPAFFAPIEQRDRWLVDGGIASYFAVATARDLGAKRVIGVDVLRPPPEIDAITPLTVAMRAFRLTLGNTLPSGEPTFLVLPDLSTTFVTAYFPRDPIHLIEAGLAAAMSALPADSATRSPLALRAPAEPPARFTELMVESPETRLAALVRAAFRDVAPGAYDTASVFAASERLYAAGLFAGVWPRIEGGRNDSTVRLVVRADAVPRARFGGAVAYDSDRGGRIWLAARHRPRGGAAELALTGAATALEDVVGVEAKGAAASLPHIAWTAGGFYRETDIRLFEADRRVAERDVGRAGAWVGIESRRLAPAIDIALTLRAEHIADEQGPDGASVGPYLRVLGFGRPARVVGEPARFEGEVRFGDVAYQRVRAAGSFGITLDRLLLAMVADIAVASDGAPPDVLPALGDDHALPGLAWGRERGRARAIGGFDIAYAALLDGYVRLRGRVGFAGGRLPDARVADRWTAAAELQFLWHTPLGAIAFGAGATHRGDRRLDVSLGPTF